MCKAMIAMSGGVDSAVAAFLMKEAGYDCIGVTMKLYHNEDICIAKEKSCCSLSDVEDARMVARKLEIPYYVFNFTDNFEREVIDRFTDMYIAGGTPNPCIDCNRYIKFQKLMNRMEELQFAYVVTGHYARIAFDKAAGRYLLKKGLDASKDQSYVLYNMTQYQLAHTLFPIGNYRKTEIREIAEHNGFLNAHKKDSQDICFVPDGDYAGFIEHHCKTCFPEGDFVLEDGTVIGRHKGIIRYTTGQRRGLGLSLKEPLYVISKDLKTNRIILGKDEALYQDTLQAGDMNWISIPELTEGKALHCMAKIRYKQKEAPAVVEAIGGGKVRVQFRNAQRGITKGQALVLYDGDVVIGGGTIL